MLIELFIKGCPACEGWLAYGRQLAGSGEDYELCVWNAQQEQDVVEHEKRMALYGIRELPAIVVDGELLACCN